MEGEGRAFLELIRRGSPTKVTSKLLGREAEEEDHSNIPDVSIEAHLQRQQQQECNLYLF